MEYISDSNRYSSMIYKRCGKSGLKLPAMSLGLWHNFGNGTNVSNCKEMILGAFDLGITHFDLANNYGPDAGSAEETFGRIINAELKPYRDEILVSTKAGYYMWPGPYGEWGSKKSLVASLDQSLGRMGLDYVDIYYHHRPDPETPIEETADALAGIVHMGKALYVGISNYSPEGTRQMNKALNKLGVKCLIHQPKYSMLEQDNEKVLDVLDEEGIGSIAFSPLAQGLLTDKYIHGIPENSRAAGNSIFLNRDSITPEKIESIIKLNQVASERNQTLAQMALVWVLRRTTSVIIGASRLEQIKENVHALTNIEFSNEEISTIYTILNK